MGGLAMAFDLGWSGRVLTESLVMATPVLNRGWRNPAITKQIEAYTQSTSSVIPERLQIIRPTGVHGEVSWADVVFSPHQGGVGGARITKPKTR